MQTIRIIIAKRKLIYVKKLTMTAVSRSKLQQICYFKTVSPKPVPLNRAISPAHNMFYFNADNAAARKPRDRRSASCSSIPGLQWFNKLFNGAMTSNVTPSCRTGPGLVNTIFAESWKQYGENVFSVIQLFWSTQELTLQTDIYIFSTQNYFSVIA